jgi:hypothetical protein
MITQPKIIAWRFLASAGRKKFSGIFRSRAANKLHRSIGNNSGNQEIEFSGALARTSAQTGIVAGLFGSVVGVGGGVIMVSAYSVFFLRIVSYSLFLYFSTFRHNFGLCYSFASEALIEMNFCSGCLFFSLFLALYYIFSAQC